MWFDGNLNLEVTEYYKLLYNPEGDSGGGSDDDKGGGAGGVGGGSESTPSYQPRKRCTR